MHNNSGVCLAEEETFPRLIRAPSNGIRLYYFTITLSWTSKIQLWAPWPRLANHHDTHTKISLQLMKN